MPATGPDRTQHPRHPALVLAAISTATLALGLLPGCSVNKDGTGYLAGDGGDGRPPNVARPDAGDGVSRADTGVTPLVDALVPPADAAPDAPPLLPDAASSPPDAAPLPACTAGERRCVDKIPESCADGAWVAAAACPFFCTAGACTGDCLPGATRCVNRNAQVCSPQAVWMSLNACPFACANGSCTGVCLPGSVTCLGTRRRTCRADASGYNDMDCPAPAGGIATCAGGTCGSECNDPARRFRCGNACCQCQRHEDCPRNNVCSSGSCRFQAPVIHITGGFYGRNCQGMNFPAVPPDARPDRTAHLAQACEGKPSCVYDVDHTVIGDPAAGCGKIYEATWQCVSGATRTNHMATLPAEASFGPNLTIACAP